jgi:hypothetical protein
MFDPVRPSKAAQRRSLDLLGECLVGAVMFAVGVAIIIALPTIIALALFIARP